MSLLDGWFLHKEKELARANPVEVQLFPYLGADAVASTWDELTYEHYRLNEPSRDLPNGIFDAPPPYGKKILILTIEIDEQAPVRERERK